MAIIQAAIWIQAFGKEDLLARPPHLFTYKIQPKYIWRSLTAQPFYLLSMKKLSMLLFLNQLSFKRGYHSYKEKVMKSY